MVSSEVRLKGDSSQPRRLKGRFRMEGSFLFLPFMAKWTPKGTKMGGEGPLSSALRVRGPNGAQRSRESHVT